MQTWKTIEYCIFYLEVVDKSWVHENIKTGIRNWGLQKAGAREGGEGLKNSINSICSLFGFIIWVIFSLISHIHCGLAVTQVTLFLFQDRGSLE